MEDLRVSALQFVVDSIEPGSDCSSELQVQKLGLRFGEQIVYIFNEPVNFKNGLDSVVSIKKGKICFCEDGRLGFDVFARLQNGIKVSAPVSFISFDEKNYNSLLKTTLTLRDSSRRQLLRVNCIARRSVMLAPSGKSVLIDASSQTKNPSKKSVLCQANPALVNVGVQTSKSRQRNAWTADQRETSDAGTQTDGGKSASTSALTQRELFKMIMFLVYKVATQITPTKKEDNGRLRPAMKTPEPEVQTVVDLQAAKQFSEMRKRQIEQMRARLQQMADERREMLEATNSRHPLDPKPVSLGKKTVQVSEPSNLVKKAVQINTPTPPHPSVSKVPSPIPRLKSPSPIPKLKSPSPIPKLKSPSPSVTTPEFPNHVMDELLRPESVISSLHSLKTDSQVLEELPSPSMEEPASTVERRKSYTLLGHPTSNFPPGSPVPSTAIIPVQKGSSHFLLPTMNVPNVPFPSAPRSEVSVSVIAKPSENVSNPASSQNASSRSEASLASTSNLSIKTSSATSSSSKSESTNKSSSSSSTSTSRSSASTTATSSSKSTPSESSEASSSTLRQKSPVQSESSSTLGVGSDATVDSVPEELPASDAGSVSSEVQSAKQESYYDSFESLKSDSPVSASATKVQLDQSNQSTELSPVTRYFRKPDRRFEFAHARSSIHTDTVSSYEPSDE